MSDKHITFVSFTTSFLLQVRLVVEYSCYSTSFFIFPTVSVFVNYLFGRPWKNFLEFKLHSLFQSFPRISPYFYNFLITCSASQPIGIDRDSTSLGIIFASLTTFLSVVATSLSSSSYYTTTFTFPIRCSITVPTISPYVSPYRFSIRTVAIVAFQTYSLDRHTMNVSTMSSSPSFPPSG